MVFEGRPISSKNGKYMSCLQVLLLNPGREYHIRALVALVDKGEVPARFQAEAIPDELSVEEYEKALQAAQEKAEEARENGRVEDAESYQEKKDGSQEKTCQKTGAQKRRPQDDHPQKNRRQKTGSQGNA